jgi:hypothetical protein
MTPTLEQFVESLTQSGLMTAAEVDKFVERLPLEHRPTRPEALAKELYRQGKLTKFQAQAIYQGKTRGLVIGNYVVLDQLGKGGMGKVYKARHRRLDRVVAIKVLLSASARSKDAVKRFQREARAAARSSRYEGPKDLTPQTEVYAIACSPDGQCQGSPGVEAGLVYIVQTDDGQETLTPEEFRRKYRRTMDPARTEPGVGTAPSSSGPHPSPLPKGEGTEAPPPAVAPFDTKQAKQHQQAWAKHLRARTIP